MARCGCSGSGECISGNANNALTRDASGCLYVQPGASTVSVGPGLSGNGAPGTPVTPNVSGWTFPCPAETAASVIVVDNNGVLKGEPGYHTAYFEDFQQFIPEPGNNLVPATDTVVNVFQFPVTNPDLCRGVRVIVRRDIDVFFDLPIGGEGAAGIGPNQLVHVKNNGTDFYAANHGQYSVMSQANGFLGPGANQVLGLDAVLGGGVGGGAFSLIQVSFHVIMLPV